MTPPSIPPFIVLFPTLEISNKVIAPKNFEKTSFEYDIINVKTGAMSKSRSLSRLTPQSESWSPAAQSTWSFRRTSRFPGYIVTTTSTPDCRDCNLLTRLATSRSISLTSHAACACSTPRITYAYIRGYEDGTIRPEGNITRAEVATIFYSSPQLRGSAAFKTTENTFTDVDSDVWYNLSVSTLAKAGAISGYPDGFLQPERQDHPRRSSSLIATRFFTTIEVGDSKFSDIAGHWAAKAIDEAYIKGIIKGYSDGTLQTGLGCHPRQAMKIVTGILGRPIDTCVLIEGIKLWPDVVIRRLVLLRGGRGYQRSQV